MYFQSALDWLGEDRPTHTCFYREDLVNMLVRMVFWNKLDDSNWPKYVPRGVQPPFWGELVPSKVLDAKVLLEESESEQNDESEESVRSDAGKEGPGDDANDADVPTVAEKPSQRRKRPSSHTSVRDQPPAKRSRRDSRSPLAQKEYSQRTAEDKAVVETPGDGVTS
ncbi:hypothetical protein PR001_g13283 [Phytophthora rubi]|uniref:Uncharacterized protein n=1 Tax=Phytophthora rubi TaxID=129364 RepID=A0A6A3LUX4_9STRA|nr:hypothetical protein PR001_g13283 [Phytophthora rubi]